MAKLTEQERQAMKGVKNEDLGLPTDEQYKARGIGTGQDKESIKQRLMVALEEAGYIETLTTPAMQQEFAMELDQLVELLVKEDLRAAAAHPLMKKIEQVMPGEAPQAPQAAPQQGPTNFAGMVKPPMGGGMSGR